MKNKLLFLSLILISIVSTPVISATPTSGAYGSLDLSGESAALADTSKYAPGNHIGLNLVERWSLYPKAPERVPMYMLEVTRDRYKPDNVVHIRLQYNKTKHDFYFWNAGTEKLFAENYEFKKNLPPIQGIKVSESDGTITFNNVQLNCSDIRGKNLGKLLVNGTLKMK